MKITLIGYMGSGKTCIGKKLSKKININFFDLDSIIESHQKISISNLFKKKGEPFFRKIEHNILKTFLQKNEKYILSVGGGTPCFYNNIQLLNKYSKTFYLIVNTYTLFKRLLLDKEKRPLISHFQNDDLFQFIIKNLSNRIGFYNQSIKKIDANNKSQNQIVETIIKHL
ncbi:shikimate kinase [Blattabacterium cuenoti]|uniref:shikimate kinase n=1 Tax=Blattabacterium cuenoti TaxID=1653831 RepID=UPI00163C834A|nr:shikimate kinase [Blattabacterium cuenoti]